MRQAEGLPPRPYIPPIMYGAVGMLIACAALTQRAWSGYDFSRGLAPDCKDACFSCLAGSLLVGFIILIGRKSINLRAHVPPLMARLLRNVAWVMLGIILGSTSSIAWITRIDGQIQAAQRLSVSACSIGVVSDPSQHDRGFSATAVLHAPSHQQIRVQLMSKMLIDRGMRVTSVGRIKPLGDNNWSRSRFLKGEICQVEVIKVLSNMEDASRVPVLSIRQKILDTVHPQDHDAAALVVGILCGRTTELNQFDASDDFATTGLSHLIAVSGGHLALIAGLLQGLFKARGMRPPSRLAVLSILMVAYVIFTGCAPSATRSLLMVLASLVTGLLGRRPHAITGLALAIISLSLLDAAVVWDIGFQLSALSVLFISLFASYTSFLLERAHLPSSLAEALSLTLCAQWATIPITVNVFGEVSLISPIANLVVGPLMSALLVLSIMIVPLCAGASVFSWLLALPFAIARLSIFCTQVFSGIPHASMHVSGSLLVPFALYGIAGIIYALWRTWRLREVMAISGAAALISISSWIYWDRCAPASITVLDVGQADSILIRDGNQVMLVDAGVDDAVVDALVRQHVHHIDALLITHWDADHWGGAPDIFSYCDVGRVFVANGAAEEVPREFADMLSAQITELTYGSELSVGSYRCSMVWPFEPVSGTENEDSLCLAVQYDDGSISHSVLLTGDTEIVQERQYMDGVGDIDVLKVGHHGSKVSVNEEVLDVLKPEVAIASAGENNRYGHPSSECADAVEESGATFLCTKDAGDITISPTVHGYKVSIAHGSLEPTQQVR